MSSGTGCFVGICGLHFQGKLTLTMEVAYFSSYWYPRIRLWVKLPNYRPGH